jgi:hypothetical protein
VDLKLLARADLAIVIVNENDMAISLHHANLLDQSGFAKGPEPGADLSMRSGMLVRRNHDARTAFA